ncbi:unnamed protein product [Sphagnum tenellum]
MVNLMQRSESANREKGEDCTQRHVSGSSKVMGGAGQSSQQGICEQLVELGSESDSDSSESSEETTQLVENDEGASEFGDTEFEELVKKEGPQQILQLTMQAKADEFMKEELADDDDYADWIQWAAEEEQRMQRLSEAAIAAEESMLLQLQQMEIVDSSSCVEK